MVGDEIRLNKSESILKLLKKYSINSDEFYYVGDAPSDVIACREAGVTSLSAAWSDSADLEEMKKINPTYIFNNIYDLKIFWNSNYKTILNFFVWEISCDVSYDNAPVNFLIRFLFKVIIFRCLVIF